MIDREKVTKGLAAHLGNKSPQCKECPYFNFVDMRRYNDPNPCLLSMMADALALLKEQEAKPVKITKNAYNHKFYYCPNCGRGFEDTYYKRPLYCDKCGQKVKWDDV